MYGARTTKKKWIERISKYDWLNADLNIPKIGSGYQQVIERFEEGWLLRLFDNYYESFRIYFDDKEEIILKQNFLGTSGVQGFLPAIRRMGYHEEEQVYKWESYIIDRGGYFKYLDTSKAKMCAVRLVFSEEIRYSAELLIKMGYSKLAEIYVNKHPFIDIKKALKNQPELLKKPSSNKLLFAEECNFKYQRGMLKYEPYFLNKLLKLVSWEKWKKLKKQGYDIRDYIDYREDNKKYNLPNFPDDLQKAKERLLDYQDEERYKIEDELIKHIHLPSFTIKNYNVIPPKSSKDLKANGKELKHCILTYTPRFANREIDIYLIKQSEEHVGTIEVMDGKVIQCRGKHNVDMTKGFKRIIRKVENYYEGATI